jgi:hypothetical protein
MIEWLRKLVNDASFAPGIASSLAASALTLILSIVFKVRPPRISNLLFWKAFSKDLVIVISEVPTAYDPDVRPGQQPQLTPMCDAIALGDFLHYFRGTFKTEPEVVSIAEESDFDRIKHRNVLVIGGPKYNLACVALLKEIDSELPYQFKRFRVQSERIIRDPDLKQFVSNEADLPPLACLANDEWDFGSVVLRKGLFQSNRSVLVVAGLSTLATLGSANWIRSRRFPFWIRNGLSSRGFEVIIKCRTLSSVRVAQVSEVFSRRFKGS